MVILVMVMVIWVMGDGYGDMVMVIGVIWVMVMVIWRW